jgi:cyclomaltodextrinase / maltogenic alpha-amylase / neopullulanase
MRKLPPYVVLAAALMAASYASFSAGQEIGSQASIPPTASRVPAWTTDARWYYVKIPRFRNADPFNDPDGTLPWTTDWPPLESDESAPREKTGEYLLPHARRYGGDLRGVIQKLPYLKKLGINAICLSPVFHGAGELKLAQADLRHVDDFLGVKGGISQANNEGAKADSWVWTPSDMLLRELIHNAHELGIRVVISGIFYAVMTADSPPSELEAYYLAATRRWMDPDGDGNPLDGVDGWLASIEEGPFRAFDEKYKAFWSRWRETVWKLNPDAVVINSGILAVSQLKDGPFDIALHTTSAGPLHEFFGVQKTRKSKATALFDSLESSAAVAPAPTGFNNIAIVSGGHLNARLLTAVAATEPLRKGRQMSPGPVSDEAARARWKLATIMHHFLPGAPITWYGDEVGMFGGPGDLADAPMWWSDSVSGAVKSDHFQPEFFGLVQWLHHMREEYPVLRKGTLRRVLMDDENKVIAFARSMPEQEIILVINHGDAKQLVMLPAGKPGQMVGVRNPHLKPPRGAKKLAEGADGEFAPLSVAGARQFVGPEGKIRMWLDPMSVRVVFLGESQ